MNYKLIPCIILTVVYPGFFVWLITSKFNIYIFVYVLVFYVALIIGTGWLAIKND